MKCILAMTFLILLIGCPKEKVDPVIPRENTGTLHIEKFDGHLWVVYCKNTGNAGMGGLAHHPDCQCMKK